MAADRTNGIAAVLSFLIPGLGQLYKGRIFLGLIQFGVTTVGYWLLFFPGFFLHILVIWHAFTCKAK